MIIHIDMDAFYASVEIRDNPALQGKPVVVGGSPQGRGVISAASYEARRFGIHSAMPSSAAIRLCPQLVFLRPRMGHYVNISRQIREIFFRFTPLVEPLSLDEAFLDVRGSFSLFGPAPVIASRIQQLIRDELGLPSSAGVAPNKFLAKVASDLQKPQGLVVVPEDGVQAFLDPLPIRRVWGIGPQTEKKFHALGVNTVAGIRKLPAELLRRRFGINSGHFWRLSRGLDTRPVVPEREAKSISHETTFPADIDDAETLLAWVQELAGQVTMRMRRLQVRGKKVQLKVRFSDFRTITRDHTLDHYSSSSADVRATARQLLQKLLAKNGQPVRLLGIAVANLGFNTAVQGTLFDEAARQRIARIDETCDAVKQKFGSQAIRPASALQHGIHLKRDPEDFE
jgi:DNA polymerase-4